MLAHDAYELGLGIGVAGFVTVQPGSGGNGNGSRGAAVSSALARMRRGNFGDAGGGHGYGHATREDAPACVPVMDPARVAAATGGATTPAVAKAVANRLAAARHPHMARTAINRAGTVVAAQPARVSPTKGTCVGCGPTTKAMPAIPRSVAKAASPALKRAMVRKGVPVTTRLGAIVDFGSATSSDIPEGEEPTGVQGWIDTSKPQPAPAGSGWPPTPPYRPGNWDFTKSTYQLALGDTLSGLANLYLGSYQRWKEIWQLQSFRYTRSPDKLMAGETLTMPFEARDKAQKMLTNTQAAPSTSGHKSPIPVAGEDPNAPTAPGATVALGKSALLKYGPWVAGGLAVVGIGYVALS